VWPMSILWLCQCGDSLNVQYSAAVGEIVMWFYPTT
jgi:hypothetical protein